MQCCRPSLSCSLAGRPRSVNLGDHSGLHLAYNFAFEGRRLLVLATTSLRPVLTEVGLSEVFDSELRVPPIAHLRALDCVLRDVELFPSGGDRRNAIQMLAEAGFASERDSESSSQLHIGIKKLLSIIEMARQEPDNIAQRLVGALTGLGM